MMPLHHSLRFRLTLIVVILTVLPVIVVGAVIGYRSFTSLKQQSLALERGVAEGVASEIRAVIDGWEENLVSLDRVHGLGVLDLKEQRNILSNLLLHDRVLQEVALLNSKGQEQIRLSRSSVILGDDLETRIANEYFLYPYEQGGTYFGSVRFSEDIREPLLRISVPLSDRRSGEVISVLVGDFRFKTIWDLLGATELSGEGDVYVIDQTGRVVAHRNPAVVLRGTTRDLAEEDHSAVGLSGEDVIVAKSRLRFGNEELVVVAEQPTSFAFKLANDNIRIFVATVSAVLVLSIIFGVYVTRQIVKPIKALAKSAVAVSSGDLSRQVEVKGRGEIGQLASAFDQMIRDLKDSRERLEQYNALQLESKNEQLQRENSARKLAEEALEDTNSRLTEALVELKENHRETVQKERLLALGQLASGIAHDFNNSLMPILGFSELLLARPESLNDKEKTVEKLRMINAAAKDAGETIGRLREFYRLRKVEESYAPVSINDLVARSISLTQTKWKVEAEAGGIVINLETDLQEVPPIMGSESELRDMLTNLIFNAVDAMPNGGTLTIRTRADEEHVVLEVSDTGTGMTEEVRQRCLDPFFTTKGDRGTGMGLAVVAGTIKRHDGTMQIKSEPDKGATLIIRLPATQQQIGQEDEEVVATPTRQLHILVVDDEPAIRKVVAEYLTVDGHTVETACDGREALDKFTSGKFDLVVTDRAMPKVSGDQLATAIKTIAPRPVILLTGFGDIMKSRGEKPAGVNMILRKPVTLLQLRDAVAKVMAQ